MQELRKEHKRLKKNTLKSHKRMRRKEKYRKRDKMIHDDALKETNAFVKKLENYHHLAEVQDIKVHIK